MGGPIAENQECFYSLKNSDIRIHTLNDAKLSGAKALKAGWIDLWASSNIFFANISGIAPGDFEPINTFDTCKLYIAFSKETSSEIVDRLQTRLDEMKYDATFDRIKEK